MPIYHQLGKMPPKRHIVFRKDGGGLYYEELIGNKGFVGPSSLLYHVQHPTQVRSVQAAEEIWPGKRIRTSTFRTGTSRRRSCRRPTSITADRIPLLFNDDVALDVRAADAGGRLLLSQRAGRRGRLRQRRRGRARDAARRAAVPRRATTWSSRAASCIAIGSRRRRCGVSSSRAAATCARRSAIATSTAS